MVNGPTVLVGVEGLAALGTREDKQCIAIIIRGCHNDNEA